MLRLVLSAFALVPATIRLPRRRSLMLGALLLLLPTLASQAAHAGAFSVSYGLNGGYGFSSEGAIVNYIAQPASATFTFKGLATRATPNATFGNLQVTGLSLNVSGSGNPIFTVSGFTQPNPTGFLFGLGSFSGANAAGTSASFGFFSANVAGLASFAFKSLGGTAPLLGQTDFKGSWGGGAGVGYACALSLGSCDTLRSNPTVSVSPAIGPIGFSVIGQEIAVNLSLAPVPEPGTGALLGMGASALLVAGVLHRRRS